MTPKLANYTAAVIGVGKAEASSVKGGGHQIGHTHGAMLRRGAPRVDLVAAADIVPANLDAFCAKFAVPAPFADYRQMLAEARPDIVSICTYMGLHREMIEACAAAGVKAVICEKPFLPSPADCRAIRNLVERTGLKIIIPHIRRYLPVFRRARELYTGGAVGQPVLCFAGIAGWDLSEMGSHWLDMFRHFHADAPLRWVMGQARVRDQRGYGHAMEEHAIAYFEFEGGGKGLVDGGCAMNGDINMTLTGTTGTIRIVGEQRLVLQTSAGETTQDFDTEPDSNWEGMWDHLLADLVAWLDGGPEPILGLTNTLPTCELALGAYLSAKRGDRVDLPLDSDETEWPLEEMARRENRG
ncbi:MAG: Gfo/Idh/MocA family oxidoreductase [Candidatus Sumerlaeaceae bacterium]|nr:Gfo/Idh/MocA family oxidoreductase [Candidatus Sumerlaeaceae bacterium]